MAIWLRACSTRAAAARRSWLPRSASSMSACRGGSPKIAHHGESASEAASPGPRWPRVVSGVGTAGRRYLGPSAQAARSGTSTTTEKRMRQPRVRCALPTLEFSACARRQARRLWLARDGPRGRRAPENHVEHGRQEEAEERDAEHAAEHGRSERPAHLGAGSGRARERQHAKDERERGHQDRPEAEPARLDGGREAVLALLLLLLRELDDEHGVLRGQPDQRDEPDLLEEVVVQAPQPRAEERERQAHRCDKDDRERQRPALVLGGMDEEHEEDAERKDEDRGVARELRLVGDIGPFDLHPGREHLRRQPLHRCHRRALTPTRLRVAVHLRSWEDIVADDAIRAPALHYPGRGACSGPRYRGPAPAAVGSRRCSPPRSRTNTAAGSR